MTMFLCTSISAQPETSPLESAPRASVVVVDQEVVQVQYPVVPSVVTALVLVEPVEPVAMQEKLQQIFQVKLQPRDFNHPGSKYPALAVVVDPVVPAWHSAEVELYQPHHQ
jgi:hypothetical protein